MLSADVDVELIIVNAFIAIFFRGDDGPALIEVTWPPYEGPKQGFGDLTGKHAPICHFNAI